MRVLFSTVAGGVSGCLCRSGISSSVEVFRLRFFLGFVRTIAIVRDVVFLGVLSGTGTGPQLS